LIPRQLTTTISLKIKRKINRIFIYLTVFVGFSRNVGNVVYSERLLVSIFVSVLVATMIKKYLKNCIWCVLYAKKQ